ncbi:MAG: hypothetical protein WBG18_17320 [Xanthobacteraceae bacterium]
MQTLRELNDRELDAVCGGGHHHSSGGSTFQLNESLNFANVKFSSDVNIIQGSNITGGVLQNNF